MIAARAESSPAGIALLRRRHCKIPCRWQLSRRKIEAGELTAVALRWTCPPLRPSGRPPTVAFLLDQERPMAALRTGLSIQAQGFNLFVSGLIGSGRTAVVEHLLRDIRPWCARVADRVFVHNFREPNRPPIRS